MTDSKAVVVVGLGLIGGSVARALSANGIEVIAYDRNPESIDAAVAQRVIKRSIGADLENISGAAVVVIALPGDATRDLIRRSARVFDSAKLVMDVGSAKKLVVEAAEASGIGAKFVGCHPLAGDHRSGWSASRADMFHGHDVFLCPSRQTSDEALEAAEDFWKALGALPVVADASTHDSRMAWVSHLPHILSSSLALTLLDAGLSRAELGPGGRDMTRLSGSSAEMWTAIAHENAVAITSAISAFEKKLSSFKNAVACSDTDSFRAQFAAGSDWFSGS